MWVLLSFSLVCLLLLSRVRFLYVVLLFRWANFYVGFVTYIPNYNFPHTDQTPIYLEQVKVYPLRSIGGVVGLQGSCLHFVTPSHPFVLYFHNNTPQTPNTNNTKHYSLFHTCIFRSCLISFDPSSWWGCVLARCFAALVWGCVKSNTHTIVVLWLCCVCLFFQLTVCLASNGVNFVNPLDIKVWINDNVECNPVWFWSAGKKAPTHQQ